MGRALAMVAMLVVGIAAAAQSAPLQGSVQVNNNVTIPTDEFASGDACNAPTGILISPCKTLHDYLKDGGSDPTCLQMLRQAIAAAQDEIRLMDQAQKAGGFQGSTYQQYVADGAKLNTLVSNFEIQCLPIQKSNPTQPIRTLLQGWAGQSQAKGFPAQTTAETLSQEPDALIAAATPCDTLLQTAVSQESTGYALLLQAAQNPSNQATLSAQSDAAFAASQRALNQFNQCFDHNVATAPVAPMTLAGVAKKLNPQYDLSNPADVGKLGTDIIGNFLTQLGLGYAVKFLPAQLQEVFGHTGESLPPVRSVPPPTPEWGPPVGAAAPNWLPPSGLAIEYPAGVELPAPVDNTPRPVYLQQQATSCALACIRMVVETIGRKPVSEAGVLQHLPPGSFNPAVGTDPIGAIAQGLKNMGVPATLKGFATIDQLAASVKDGYPAIIRVGTPSEGHAVILDAVVGTTPGSRYFFIRDPLNPQFLDPSLRQVLEAAPAGFRNAPVLTEQDFARIYQVNGTSGQAVLTHP